MKQLSMKRKVAINEYLLFAEAWLMLGLARLTIVLLPFRLVAKLLGEKHSDEASYQNKATTIGTAIVRASKRSFWRAKCLEQALAASAMLRLRRRSCTVYFGVADNSSNKSLAAHAWVVSNGIIVTGGKGVEEFKVVGIFKR